MYESDKIVEEQAEFCRDGGGGDLACVRNYLCVAARDIPGFVGRLVSDFSDVKFQQEIQSRIHETSTHYVWRLSRDPFNHVTAWLNEYKNLDGASTGYASTIHNHRYDFVSLIVSGGYDYNLYDLDVETRCHELTGQGAVRRGDVIVVKHSEYHRLERILPRTITFLLKFRPAKDFSTSLDLGTGKITQHIAHHLRPKLVLEALKEVL